mgnify:CR=1 FL=1
MTKYKVIPLGNVIKRYFFPSWESIEQLTAKRSASDNPALWSSITLVGLMYSGKTTTAKKIAYMAKKKYGWENVNCILANTLGDTKPHINNKPIQVLIVDDAPTGQKYRHIARDQDVKDYFAIRHIARKKSDKVKYVIIIFCTQRWHNLDIVFRNAKLVGFKTIMMDRRDNREIALYIGKDLYQELKIITDWLNDFSNPARIREAQRKLFFRLMGGKKGKIDIGDPAPQDPIDIDARMIEIDTIDNANMQIYNTTINTYHNFIRRATFDAKIQSRGQSIAIKLREKTIYITLEKARYLALAIPQLQRILKMKGMLPIEIPAIT